MKRFWMPALGALALSAAILATRPAITAPAKAPGDTTISVGYVDVQKVLQDSPAAVNARKEAESLKTRLQEKLAQQQERCASRQRKHERERGPQQAGKSRLRRWVRIRPDRLWGCRCISGAGHPCDRRTHRDRRRRRRCRGHLRWPRRS